MKHTDQLLGIFEQATKSEARDTVYDKRILMALQELEGQEGWRLFKEHCQQEQQLTLARLERSMDPTTLAKLTGVLLAITSFPSWPSQQVALLTEALDSEKESP